MALSRIVFAWLGVLALFLLGEAISGRLRRGAGRRTVLSGSAAQALLLTLLGALWFASLGTGAWWLVFLLIGGLMELSVAIGARRPRQREWRDLIGHMLGVARVMVAGGWLAWQLGPV